MEISIYEDKYCYYFFKPAGIPTTFGKEKSFLDYLHEEKHIKDKRLNLPTSLLAGIKDGKFSSSFSLSELSLTIPNFQFPIPVSNIKHVIVNQIKIFGKEKEFGLLNRLDNETEGLLYFAKNLEIFDKYRQWQKEGKIQKFYIAQVFGKFNYNKIQINYPIMHHKSKADRMIFIKTPKDLLKGRSRQHNVQTYVELLNYNGHSNISTLQIMITKGIRHQIRVHLASLGYPIIGDSIYSNNSKQKSEQNLHLRSVGQKFDFCD